jgi:hypothetical protein
MERLAEGLTDVDAVLLLLPILGSDTLLFTVAVLLKPPAVVGVTTIVTVALPPFAMLPRLQVTVLDPLQPLPWLGVADTNITPAGKGSVTVTPVAVLGPALPTINVYVKFCPTNTGSGDSVLVIERFAEVLPTVVVAVLLLLPVFGSDTQAVTLAVLLIVPVELVVTTMVTVAVAPLAIVPRLQVTVLP